MVSCNHRHYRLVHEPYEEDNRESLHEFEVLGQDHLLLGNHYWYKGHKVRQRVEDFPTGACDNVRLDSHLIIRELLTYTLALAAQHLYESIQHNEVEERGAVLDTRNIPY